MRLDRAVVYGITAARFPGKSERFWSLGSIIMEDSRHGKEERKARKSR